MNNAAWTRLGIVLSQKLGREEDDDVAEAHRTGRGTVKE
jgi:hypothetical protein